MTPPPPKPTHAGVRLQTLSGIDWFARKGAGLAHLR